VSRERFLILCVYLSTIGLFVVSLLVGFLTGRLSANEYQAQVALVITGLGALLIKLGSTAENTQNISNVETIETVEGPKEPVAADHFE
jgi:hypothetical protein